MTLICIKTYGCAHNIADSEVMAQFLSDAGFSVTFEDDKNADLIVYNTCTVKNPTDDKFFTQLQRATKSVVITGCIPQSQKNENWLKNHVAVGVDRLDKIVEAVKAKLAGQIVQFLESSSFPPTRNFLPTNRQNHFIAIIPLLQGCLGNCTYCKTKAARGNLKSYAPEDIIKQIRLAKNAGVKEMWLVSEDNGAYGLDTNTTLPNLLREIIKFESKEEDATTNQIFPAFRIRLGMLNPQYAFKYKDELAEIMQHPVFYKFLHIPVQCASNKVLKEMNRPYTIEQFTKALLTIRQAIPNFTFATDIIAGYPTETTDDFQETMKLLEQENFAILNISKFYPRPKTPAANLKLLPTKEVKRRSKAVSDWFSEQNNNEHYVGKIVRALFTNRGKNNSFLGRTKNYKQVVVQTDKDILGTMQKVKITGTTRDDLKGDLV
ncbi:tRNA (N(6)-L-threonylcarbamoyladenosine(37)-C(2))-methylthiotransferase [Candidatus Woesearchaeota archaeon]|nr:tRNA (N(6)-L-threonylcarbamoyladenosine(37)-C(2))-methylthiotransferase [Candidatus Woesearchaeota archaeon]